MAYKSLVATHNTDQEEEVEAKTKTKKKREKMKGTSDFRKNLCTIMKERV